MKTILLTTVAALLFTLMPLGMLASKAAPTDDTSTLSAAQRDAIGDYVRRCWSTDPDAQPR